MSAVKGVFNKLSASFDFDTYKNSIVDIKLHVVFSIAISIFLLEGCVGPGAISKDYTLQQKKIAVVSELGNNFHRIIVGTTVFTNSMTKTDVSDWKINHLAAAHVVKQLNQQGLNAVEVESDLLTALDGSSPYTIATVPEKVVERAKSLGYDNLLLIAPVIADIYPFFDPGFGLQTRYFFGSPSSCAYTIFTIDLYDLHADKRIGWEWMNARHGACSQRSSNDLAVKDRLEDYNEQERLEIRKRVENRIIQSLDTTLESLQILH